ncbi:MAG: Chorismate dehydratase [Deltaproteobacteria bacterium ADurb.Bin510]|nr:MAG: Chorismate dehydratase [Deltaproteobacteria bacterium ADurb.Bin510]
MKLGYIDYLNCFPFYSRLLERPIAGVEIVPGYPSELNELMRRGELDMSPISTAAYADVQSEVVILPDYCLASVGYVRSVILISKHPIENLDAKRVGLTNASQTSTALLRALLTKFYGVTPVYEPCAPKPDLDDLDAALIIGNEALLPEKTATPYVYDLGDLWLRKTGFPVVFAVFAVRKAAIQQQPELLKAVIRSYHDSHKRLFNDKDQLIVGARERYPAVAFDLHDYYLNLMKFEFTGQLKQAFAYYLKTCAELGLVAPTGPVEFLPDEFSLANL